MTEDIDVMSDLSWRDCFILLITKELIIIFSFYILLLISLLDNINLQKTIIQEFRNNPDNAGL